MFCSKKAKAALAEKEKEEETRARRHQLMDDMIYLLKKPETSGNIFTSILKESYTFGGGHSSAYAAVKGIANSVFNENLDSAIKYGPLGKRLLEKPRKDKPKKKKAGK